MPPWTSTTLPELSTSASREGGEQRKLTIEVHLHTKDGLEILDASFDSSQTVQDLKVYFEKVKGKAVCSAENMVIYHDGTKLSSITTLGSLDLRTWNSILITLQEDINEPTSNLAPAQETTLDEGDYPTWEITNEDLLRFEYDVSASDQEAMEVPQAPDNVGVEFRIHRWVRALLAQFEPELHWDMQWAPAAHVKFVEKLAGVYRLAE